MRLLDYNLVIVCLVPSSDLILSPSLPLDSHEVLDDQGALNSGTSVEVIHIIAATGSVLVALVLVLPLPLS